MLDHANLEEYADPEIYDSENRKFEPDGPFYLALAERTGGPVLELGCGAGRVAIPLARQGIEVTGLDVSPGMLALARHKSGDLPVRWVRADVRDFHLPTRFGLIYMAGGSVHHMLTRTDHESLLSQVRGHLKPGGVFAFDAIIPRPGMMTDAQEEEEWHSYTDSRGREIRLSGTQRYDPLRQIKHETAYRRWIDADGREVTRRARLALRYVFPQEMEALLHYNGLEVLERHGDWDLGPPIADSRTLVFVCANNV